MTSIAKTKGLVADGQPRNRAYRDHTGGAAQGLCLRHLSHGRERRRSGALLDRAGHARDHPAQRVPYTVAAGAHGQGDAVHRGGRPRLRRGDRGLRRAQAWPCPHLDQRAYPPHLPRTLRARALPYRRGLRRRRAGRRALRRLARPRVLRREHVPPRARCLENCAGAFDRAAQRRRLPAARHAIRDRSSQELRRRRSAEAALSRAARAGADRGSRFRRVAGRSLR